MVSTNRPIDLKIDVLPADCSTRNLVILQRTPHIVYRLLPTGTLLRRQEWTRGAWRWLLVA